MDLKRISIICSLVLIMFMTAIETSIVSLALPTMRDDLHATQPISLVFTVYFVGIVLSIPILSELMSRIKIIYVTMAGLILFLVGSLLSGMSTQFEMLVFARLLQGVGAGANMSLAQIVTKLAFEIPFRYKVIGVVGSVWGISSILGPFLGGFILEVSTWHWLFYINIPIAVLVMGLVLMSYHFENESTLKHKVDFVGMFQFYVLLALLMASVLITGHIWMNIVSFILFVLLIVIMFKRMKKVSPSFIPVDEFVPTVRLAFLTDFFIAVVLIGFNVFIPSYLQDHLGLSPLQSGLIIFPLSIGWLLINFTLEKIEAHRTVRGLYLLAIGILIVGSISIIINAFHPIIVAVTLAFIGASFGTAYTKDSVMVQEGTSPESMKKMMSLFTLTRNMGSSIGSAIMGYIYAMDGFLFKASIQDVMIFCLMILVALMIVWFTRKDKSLRTVSEK
ncbi:multidrug efflux MFS transporter SdrM [Staphylococcus delphini]|uniref:multidrug efflux MFS transporter SdrM n=1 Tax=Staphylococcus delphini TaxID=53344 RepID=UPI000BBCABA4|nr:multidrug efflux MFS transporter SdrM [Staphylococcus delphini]PCF36359.1 MFS transporter [Staphylococcus delphini]PCF51358.1 MFS transporter [Staphylococcus delphini]PCF55904.1 MFS transporter [Staphylococcus delphini]PCF59260.1 MFS transporter [Staphylococcus delphini]